MPREAPRDQWDSPIPDYDILSHETCLFILEQAKEYFNEIIEEAESLTQRSMRMLFLFLPAIAAVIGYCISNQDKLKVLTELDVLLLIIVSACAIYCGFNLFRLISPKRRHYKGGMPEEVMRPEIFELKNIMLVEKALYISEIEKYQVKIEQMKFSNKKRIDLYYRMVYSFNTMLFVGISLLLHLIF